MWLSQYAHATIKGKFAIKTVKKTETKSISIWILKEIGKENMYLHILSHAALCTFGDITE
jgi:hypothetical protein